MLNEEKNTNHHTSANYLPANYLPANYPYTQ